MKTITLHRLMTLAAACAAAALLLAPAGASAAKLKANLRGVQISAIAPDSNPDRLDADLARAQQVGAKVVRTDLRWWALEPTKGQHDDNYLALADHVIGEAHKRGLKVFLTVLGTPCWTTTAPNADCSTPSGRSDAYAYPPADNAAFASFAAFVAKRWQNDLAALEIWNEPDQRNELYWKGPDKVARYAALLKAAYPAIKAAASNVKVAGAGIVGANGAFLKALYAQGIKGSYDVLSVHYYDLVLLSLGQIRAVRQAAGDTKPMWLGEYGWTSCLSKRVKTQQQHTCVSRSYQARNTLDALDQMRGLKDLAGAILYTMHDDDEYDFGLLDKSGKRKPLFNAVSRAFHGKLGKAHKIVFGLRARRGTVVVKGSGPAGDAYLLEARVHGQLRYEVAFRGDRYNRFTLTLPKQLGTHGVKVSIRRYSVKGRAASHTI
jgi:hypothetical protein